jgi:hypothetical protein
MWQKCFSSKKVRDCDEINREGKMDQYDIKTANPLLEREKASTEYGRLSANRECSLAICKPRY